MVVVVAGAWFAWAKTHQGNDPSKGLLTAKVTRGDLMETVSATGSIEAQTGAQVKIGSQITGRIKRLYADVGSYVKAGQVIAELDLPDVKAQLDQATSNLAASRTKLAQQLSGVGMERTQTVNAITTAQANLRAAEARQQVAEATAKQQVLQTPTDVRRADAALSATRAALSTAKSNQVQVQAGTNLQVANAQEQINQAQANTTNTAAILARQSALFAEGFVSAADVDVARANATVAQSQLSAAKQNLELVKQKVAADLQSASDLVAQAQENVASAEAAMASAKTGTYSDAAKQASVLDARAQVNQAQAALQTALGNKSQDILKQQDVQQARDAVKTAVAQVAFNQAQWDKTFIRSPINGTVLQLAAQQGETLAAGLSAPTLIIVADLKRLETDVYVDETDIGKLKLGQSADVRVDAFSQTAFHGTVTKIASGSTIQQGVVTYAVTVAIEDPQHNLKPDMTASVTIQTGKRTNVLLVPSEAISLTVRGSTVNLLTKTNGQTAVQPRRVKTGSSDGTNTEIKTGLKEGDTIVTAGLTTGQQRPGGGSAFGFGGGGGGGGGGGKGGGK